MIVIPQGDVSREAIDSLGRYAYQIYQSALAWLNLTENEFLFLEVAEDFAVAAENALKAVQVKKTSSKVTINSNDIVATIDSFVSLAEKNPSLEVKVKHLTTSLIGKEKSADSRIGQIPTLESWKKLSVSGEIAPLRNILDNSKLSDITKRYIKALNDQNFREQFLRRISFECGALETKYILRQLKSKLSKLIQSRGGVHSQTDGCLNSILVYLLNLSIQKYERRTDRAKLEEFIGKATHIPVNIAIYEKHMKAAGSFLNYQGSQPGSLAALQLSRPSPIDKIPFPKAIATRLEKINEIISMLQGFRLAWICGASGVGKTLSAKLAAKSLGGNWSVLNLRDLDPDQASLVITSVANELSNETIHKSWGRVLQRAYQTNY